MNSDQTAQRLALSLAALLGLAATGCASEGPKPTAELTKAHTLLAQADKSGTAQRYAPADLQRAHDELSEAERFSSKEQYKDARDQAQRAEVDADLSLARGSSGEQKKAASDIAQANAALRQESSKTNMQDTNKPSAQGSQP